jgi:hypothetical protein
MKFIQSIHDVFYKHPTMNSLEQRFLQYVFQTSIPALRSMIETYSKDFQFNTQIQVVAIDNYNIDEMTFLIESWRRTSQFVKNLLISAFGQSQVLYYTILELFLYIILVESPDFLWFFPCYLYLFLR